METRITDIMIMPKSSSTPMYWVQTKFQIAPFTKNISLIQLHFCKEEA